MLEAVVDKLSNHKSEGDIMYADFFDQPSSQVSNKQNISIEEEDQIEEEEEDVDSGDLDQDDENVEGTDEEREIQTRVQSGRDLFAASDSSEGEDIGDIFGGKKIHEKSSFEKRQEKLKERISELEETALAQKPWQLTGETTATARPENSLLQEDLEFEHTTRLAPVITEETTASLESVIKQRIKDQAFDDVERKIKPTEDAFQYKKRITLDQEKSKQSLGEIYEQEYLKQVQETEEDKTDPQHEDIKKMMQSLFIKLDALSNFHYTPKPAVPEVKIVSNMPSIVMEEVAPLSASSAALLAPEEIQEKPKGDVKGKSEATGTDRKHERRLKKKVKRLKEKEKKKRQKLIEKLKPGLSNKHSKKKALKELEKQEKSSKNLTVIKEDKSRKAGLTSSKAFFTQLQEEAKTQIRIHKTTRNEMIKAKANTAAKLKL
ncbi:U3 small nucleolar ribonucleoprotein protein MPP10 [Lingula anatina]|uniref:U3 small nucleolar ribonucleoprotein protein MPP10 n=1 Tax=Lingula anatina TaxID=7574 RepID=A0A1S3HKB3_LINAN|nr:U3 small nucleolar ribonucleoprotein protein MPP10 [Lingula anatina]|eukprot:XP_013385901.1 U3 small nucleolar ribonucleoprotein protein MPP10 [Lingula anatina]